MTEEDDEIIITSERVAAVFKTPDYQPQTQDECRRVFALAVAVDRTEPMRLGPDDFMLMCSRISDWLRDGNVPAKPSLATIKGGKNPINE